MVRALAAELMKLRRASLPLWTVATVLAAPAMSNVFLAAQRSDGGEMTWSTFFNLGAMTMGTWYGILLFGLITAFLFGREYSEGVAPTMLTTPMRREYSVIAKFIVLTGWVFVLALLSIVAQAAWATALGLKGFAWSQLWSGAADVLIVALLLSLTQSVIALFAVVGRGVFAPMIFSAFGFSVGMIGGVAGWSGWLPWAMPTAVGGTFLGTFVDVGSERLTAGSWAIAVGLFGVGLAAVIWWVNHADSR